MPKDTPKSPSVGPTKDALADEAQVVLHDEPETDGSSRADVHRLVKQYVEEIGSGAQEAIAVPGTGPRSRLVLLSVTLTTFAVGVVAFLFILFQPPTVRVDVAPTSSAPIVDIRGGDACVARQQALMRSIVEYKKQYGKFPQSLAELQPPILTAPPVDPTTNAPYEYTVADGQVMLKCPNPGEHEQAGSEHAQN